MKPCGKIIEMKATFEIKWIREELILRLPRNVLWIISGRDALRWNEIKCTGIEWDKYITQCEIEKLPGKYCIEYLKNSWNHRQKNTENYIQRE